MLIDSNMINKAFKIIFFIFFFLFSQNFIVLAKNQETELQEATLDTIFLDMSEANKILRRSRNLRDKKTAREIRAIKRKIIRAVNLIPPERCFTLLKVTSDDFFSLVSDLTSGISCGPAIIPIFFTEIDDKPVSTTDCIEPEIGTDQFSKSFSEVFPIYEDASELFRKDIDNSEVPDVCEGDTFSTRLN